MEISSSYIDGSVLMGPDALLQRYEVALFSDEGTFEGDPNFGIGLERFVGEPNNEVTAKAIKSLIQSKTELLFPEIKILTLSISKPQFNQVNIIITVQLVPYNQTSNIQKSINI